MDNISYIGWSHRWEKENPRCDLKYKLPLDTPFSIQIDPSNLCNFRCEFCPTGHPDLLQDVGRAKGQLMEWSLYCKIIDDIQKFPRPLKVLSLYKDGEPLLNPRLPDMIRLAKEKKIAHKIVVLTNASLLTREKSRDLIDAGLDVIRISVEHAHDEGYRRLTKTFGNYRQIVDNVTALWEEKQRAQSSLFIAAKLIDIALDPSDLSRFQTDFSPICDEIGRTTAQGWSHSELFDFTLGSNPTVALDGATPLKTDRICCPFPFYTMAVNANGLVSPCSDDWSQKAILGDTRTEGIFNIWNGVRMQHFRSHHLHAQRHVYEACRHCQKITGVAMDCDLDSDLARLAKIYGDQNEH